MKPEKSAGFLQKRSTRIWAAILLIVLILSGAALLVYFLSHEFFAGNQHFTLTEVRVKSKGFWQDKKDLLCDILRLKPGTTNLFSFRMGELRKRLLQREPSIQQVTFTRILPDTLEIDILERIPRALVNTMNSPLVIDSNSILLRRDRCMDVKDSLPIILGSSNVTKYPPGSKVTQFEKAVELIMLTKTSYPEMRIGAISVLRKDQLLCSLHYKGDTPDFRYRVFLPNKDLRRHVRALVTILEKLQQSRSTKHNIDLRFKNQAIITP